MNRPYYISATNFAFKKSSWEGYDVLLSQGGDEVAMIRQLKSKGRIVFLLNNPTLTSARRLRRGMFYNIFVSFFYYYLAGYHINRIFKKEIIKPAPAYREEDMKQSKYNKYISLAMSPFGILSKTSALDNKNKK